MTTAFGEILILNLDHCRTRSLKSTHGSLHVQGISKAGVRIDNDWQPNALGDAGKGVLHLREGRQTHIRSTQLGIGNGCA